MPPWEPYKKPERLIVLVPAHSVTGRFANVLLSYYCRFATWTFRYRLRRFATWTLRYLDVSHLWIFRYQDVSLSSWTFRHRTTKSSYSIANYKLSDRWRNVQGGSETFWYRKVQRCEASRWRTIQVANWQSSETSMNRSQLP